jgi:truncated hemoglobin YjbI
LDALGGEAGCRCLSEEFYSRVAQDAVLKPLFPGKSLRCATEEFGSFLIQFLGGDEEQTQSRWWLSLRESHARFRISAEQRAAWLRHMEATLGAVSLDEVSRNALREFFTGGASYVVSGDSTAAGHQELAARWEKQCALDDTIAAIAEGRDEEALALATKMTDRPAVFAGLLMCMMQAGRSDLVRFVIEAVSKEPKLIRHRFAGKTLLHAASATGCVEVVELLLRLGADANVTDRGGHGPLYSLANECAAATGPQIVTALIAAGADVNACGGVTRATPLHMAARRGYVEIALALLDHGANLQARDRKGDTPLQRAMNCRRLAIVELLQGKS